MAANSDQLFTRESAFRGDDRQLPTTPQIGPPVSLDRKSDSEDYPPFDKCPQWRS
jgi:hypothetical protein